MGTIHGNCLLVEDLNRKKSYSIIQHYLIYLKLQFEFLFNYLFLAKEWKVHTEMLTVETPFPDVGNGVNYIVLITCILLIVLHQREHVSVHHLHLQVFWYEKWRVLFWFEWCNVIWCTRIHIVIWRYITVYNNICSMAGFWSGRIKVRCTSYIFLWPSRLISSLRKIDVIYLICC